MILDPFISLSSSNGVAAHVAAEIAELCEGGILNNPDSVQELALAIEEYLSEEGDHGWVHTGELMCMASRTLQSIGEETAARKLFLFGSEMVTPSDWHVGGHMWILDMRRVLSPDNDSMEMIYFRCLDSVIDSIAELWDESDGAGILGLKNLHRSAEAVLGCESPRKRVFSLVSEVKSGIVTKLKKVGADRDWAETPRVMTLDFV